MYVYVRTFLNGMRVLVFCDRNSSAKRIISSRLILASPASQVNASCTMPAASMEVSIDKYYKNNFKNGLGHII